MHEEYKCPDVKLYRYNEVISSKVKENHSRLTIKLKDKNGILPGKNSAENSLHHQQQTHI